MNPLKTLLTVTATAALVLPAAALADSTDTTKAPSSSSQCKTLRHQMGTDGFRAAYGTNKNKRNAFGKCVSALNKAGKAEHSDSVDVCTAERTADATAFVAKYGTGKKGKNAFGKCVSSHAKHDGSEVRRDQRNAAKTCKAERSNDKAAFTAKYGTNKNKRNAFGKCVSATAKASADQRNADEAPTTD